LCEAYIKKSSDYMKMSKLVYINKFYEGSVINAYYSMYYTSLALLFKCGIKSENHGGTILLLKRLFNIDIKIISQAKKDRIDSQYYTRDNVGIEVNEKIASQAMKDAETYCNEIKVIIERLTNTQIGKVRKEFEEI